MTLHDIHAPHSVSLDDPFMHIDDPEAKLKEMKLETRAAQKRISQESDDLRSAAEELTDLIGSEIRRLRGRLQNINENAIS